MRCVKVFANPNTQKEDERNNIWYRLVWRTYCFHLSAPFHARPRLILSTALRSLRPLRPLRRIALAVPSLIGNHEAYTGQAEEWGEFVAERGFTVLNVSQRLVFVRVVVSCKRDAGAFASW